MLHLVDTTTGYCCTWLKSPLLATFYVDMPQSPFGDIEGAQVTFLYTVIPAEDLPAI
jgi:hypothetical protein